jgi:hypothetical protein
VCPPKKNRAKYNSCYTEYITLIIRYRIRKKAEADYEDAKEQLELETKQKNKLERELKALVIIISDI